MELVPSLDARTGSGGACLADLLDEAADDPTIGGHAKRLSRYAKGKASWSTRMKNFLGSREPRRAVKCHRCGNVLQFRHWLDHDRITLQGGYFCQQWKLCLTCAIQRGARVVRDLVPLLAAQLQADPLLRAYLVTVTTKDGRDMTPEVCAERFEHLRCSLRHYFEKRNDARKLRVVWRINPATGKRYKLRDEFGNVVRVAKGGDVEANKAEGIYWAFEGGKGKGSGGWHWHCHAVWLCHSAPDALRLSEEWQKITGDSFIVDVREFKCTRRGGERTTDKIASDVLEVAKYTLKPHSMTPEAAYGCQTSTSGKHFTGRVGSLRLPAEAREEIQEHYKEHLDGRYIDLFYRYCERSGVYQEMDVGGIGEHMRIMGARGVNAELAPDTRKAIAEGIIDRDHWDGAKDASLPHAGVLRFLQSERQRRRLAMGLAPGAWAPQLDTRVILGDMPPMEPDPPDPPEAISPPLPRAERWAAPINDLEDLLAD